METARHLAILAIVMGLAGQVCGQSGQVQFLGTVTTNEAHDVAPGLLRRLPRHGDR